MPVQNAPLAVPAPFVFVGDVLCLDFLNTVAEGRELLMDFPGLVRWLMDAGVLPAAQVDGVRTHWSAGRRAAASLAEARILREVLRTAIRAFSHGERIPPASLEVLNRHLAQSPVRAELVEEAGGRISKRFHLQWKETADLLAPVVASAADLLAGADRSLLHRCAGANCTLFFYDRTKNHRRRWCSAAMCGNRAKVAAHRARQKATRRSR